jgi:host factor-I protein
MEDSMKGQAPKNLQDAYLNYARKERLDLTVYLTNGVPLQGKVVSFDSFTILLEIDRKQNLIYKHAVSTIVPAKPLQMAEVIAE